MVASGTHVGSACCFAPCTGSGPWVAVDLENGMFQGDNGSNTANLGNNSTYVTAMLKNDGQTTYALKGGNSQSGWLTTWWNGALPTRGGYKPVQQEGGIILGIGGDNSKRRGARHPAALPAGVDRRAGPLSAHALHALSARPP